MDNILGFIPARGGSIRIPKKNLRKLNGKPLVSYSIELALKSKLIDKVVVSSDDEEILRVSKKYKAEVIKRPKKFATRNSKLDSGINHALGKLKKDNYVPKVVVVFQPTGPLRKLETVENAIKEFLTKGNNFDSLMPLHPISGKIGVLKKGRYVSVIKPGKQSHEVPDWYKECGTVFVFRPEVIASGKFYGDRIYPFIIRSKKEALDIDNLDDFKLAEFYMRNK